MAQERSSGNQDIGGKSIRILEPAFPGGLISWFSDIRFLIT
jgi:hypothetical protein